MEKKTKSKEERQLGEDGCIGLLDENNDNRIFQEGKGGIERITEEMLENSIKEMRSFTREIKFLVKKSRETVSAMKSLADTSERVSGNADLAYVTLCTSEDEHFTPERAEPDKDSMLKTMKAKTQKAVNNDMEMMRGIDEMYKNLSCAAETVSRSNTIFGSKQQILCSLLVADRLSHTGPSAGTSFTSAAAICKMLCTGGFRTSEVEASGGDFHHKIVSQLLPKLSGIFDEGVVTTAKHDIDKAFASAGPSTSSAPGCEIIELVNTSMLGNNETKAETAKILNAIAEGYENQMQKIEMLLEHTSSLAKELEFILKNQFRVLLESISNEAESSAECYPKERVSRKVGENSNREVKPEPDLNDIENDNDTDIEKGAKEARRLIKEVNFGIKKRYATVSILSDISKDLEALSANVDVPSGEMTAGDLMEKSDGGDDGATFKEKMKEAQNTLDLDKESMSNIDQLFGSLTQHAENLSLSRPDLGSKERILVSLLVADMFSQSATKVNTSIKSTATAFTILCSTTPAEDNLVEEILSDCTPIISNLFNVGMDMSFHKVVENLVQRSDISEESSAELASYIYEMLHTLNKGSKPKASRMLRDIAERYDEQLIQIKEFLKTLSDLAKKLESMLQFQFKILLEKISTRKEVDKKDVENVRSYLEICARSDAWTYAFKTNVTCLDSFVRKVAQIFTFLGPKLEEYTKRKENDRDVIDLTFLAHGHIRNPLLPCTLNYMNEHVQSVILYVPWGCKLHATAAWGIATGTVAPNNVQYTGQVLPGFPRQWNRLPQDYTKIPELVFTPVTNGEGVNPALTAISNMVPTDFRGLVIPYFQDPRRTPLPEVHLWALCTAVAVTAYILGVSVRIHIAACLFPDDPNLWTESIYPGNQTVNCTQYCAVPVDNPVIMGMKICDASGNLIVLDGDMQRHIDALNAALGIE